jgi:PAS domain S-box-containing protein
MGDANPLLKLSLDQFVRTSDTSQRKATDAQNLVKEYGPVLDLLNDVVFITDEEGYFVFVNRAGEQYNGVPAEVFIGRHFLDLISPEHQDVALSIFQKILNGEKIVPAIEMEMQPASGGKFTKEISWTILSKKTMRRS